MNTMKLEHRTLWVAYGRSQYHAVIEWNKTFALTSVKGFDEKEKAWDYAEEVSLKGEVEREEWERLPRSGDISTQDLRDIRDEFRMQRDDALDSGHRDPQTPMERAENNAIHKRWETASNNAHTMKKLIAFFEQRHISDI